MPKTESLEDFPSTYFIRIYDNDRIEKLFLSGEYRWKKVTNKKEKQVVTVLKGENDKIHNQGIRINEFHSDFLYLEDLYFEAEIIVPVKINNQVIGAVVRLYGD